jgi:hypothetical protein
VDPYLNPVNSAGTSHLWFVFKVLTSGLKFVLLQLAALSDKRVGPSVNGTVLFNQRQPTAVLPNMALTEGKIQYVVQMEQQYASDMKM